MFADIDMVIALVARDPCPAASAPSENLVRRKQIIDRLVNDVQNMAYLTHRIATSLVIARP